ERAHHRQRHVGLEQCDSDLAQGVLDVVFGQASAAAQCLERLLESVAQLAEHVELREVRRLLAPRAARFEQVGRSDYREFGPAWPRRVAAADRDSAGLSISPTPSYTARCFVGGYPVRC